MSTNSYHRIPHIAKEIEKLVELSLDLRWSWSHKSDAFWEKLHPELWGRTRNPFLVLQTVSKAKLEEVANDPLMRSMARMLIEDYSRQIERKGWFRDQHPESDLNVAYFSMEYGMSDALRIYSGGLGILAGDHLKTCSDLNVPLHGIGLLYQRGYFRQSLDSHGHQLEFYPYNDPSQLPVRALRDDDGEWLRVQVEFPGRMVTLKTWEVKVGSVRLFLLDSNDPLNSPADRGITSELYGGGPEIRLQQELVLGVGGWKLLDALGIEPTVCHLNEGHAAFVVLERARDYMEKHKVDFETALTALRPGTVFTTHTPVEAGFDRFDATLAHHYLAPMADQLKLDIDDLLAYSRENAANKDEPLNMAFLAIRGSGMVNGVSKLHGEVSREIFRPIFPDLPKEEVPITHVTNGIHVPSWDSNAAAEFWNDNCGAEIWFGTFEGIAEKFDEVPDELLWNLRNKLRRKLVNYVRQRLKRQLEATGFLKEKFGNGDNDVLDEDTLTIGFARRFATYKRPNLLLYDVERFIRILNNSERPVQLILAGKAHPADGAGKEMIRQLCQFIDESGMHHRVIYLTDYDMALAEHLVHGVDLWLNNPRKPMEASGTSGMKVLVNGGLNLSVPDGWWAEGYSPEAGWSIDGGEVNGGQEEQDKQDALALFSMLEDHVIPDFYQRNEEGIPEKWVAKMRRSMAALTTEFSTNRMIREYVENLYMPSHENFKRRQSEGPKASSDLTNWTRDLLLNWDRISTGEGKIQTQNGGQILNVPVFHGSAERDSLSVELVVAGKKGRVQVLPMQRGEQLAWQDDGWAYSVELPAKADLKGATIRIRPARDGAILPIELPKMKEIAIKLVK